MQRNVKLFYISVYTLIAIMLLSGLFFVLKMHIEAYALQRSIKKTYQSEVVQLMPQAINNLETDKNDWIICTDLGLSLENIDDPKTMAAWIAYYKYGKIYCMQWWDWPKDDPCAYMQKQLKNTTNNEHETLLKKIILCKIAKEFKN